MVQHITEPTHYRGHVLDLLMTHNENTVNLCNIGVVEGISDHSALMCELSLPKQSNQKKIVTTRNLKSVDPKECR